MRMCMCGCLDWTPVSCDAFGTRLPGDILHCVTGIKHRQHTDVCMTVEGNTVGHGIQTARRSKEGHKFKARSKHGQTVSGHIAQPRCVHQGGVCCRTPGYRGRVTEHTPTNQCRRSHWAGPAPLASQQHGEPLCRSNETLVGQNKTYQNTTAPGTEWADHWSRPSCLCVKWGQWEGCPLG